MTDYSYAFKKAFMDRLGLPVEQFDDVFVPPTPAAPPPPKSYAYKKAFMDRLGLPVEQFDDVIRTGKKPAQQAQYKSLIEQSRPIDERLVAKAAPIGTPYGKSFLSYTPEGKVAGIASKLINTASGAVGKALQAGMKAAGPVGAALTAYDLGAALGEARKLGDEAIARDVQAEKLAEEKKGSPLTPAERANIRTILNKAKMMRGEPGLNK